MTLVADPVLNGTGRACPRTTVERADGAGGATAVGRGGLAACCLGTAGGLCVTAREGAVRGGGLRAAGLAVGRLVSNVPAVVVGTGLMG